MAERRYLREFDDGAEYCVFEHAARTEKLGIWRLPADQRIAPWEWRRRNELDDFTDYASETVIGCVAAIGKPLRRSTTMDESADERREEPSTAAWSCDARKTCAQMSSCGEAKFHLQQCRAPIDGDDDGIPCEAICR